MLKAGRARRVRRILYASPTSQIRNPHHEIRRIYQLSGFTHDKPGVLMRIGRSAIPDFPKSEIPRIYQLSGCADDKPGVLTRIGRSAIPGFPKTDLPKNPKSQIPNPKCTLRITYSPPHPPQKKPRAESS